MTTTLVIPTIVVGDNVLQTANANNALVSAAINSFDGGNIQPATVANAALAKGKAIFPVLGCFYIGDVTANLASRTIPVVAMPFVDGASSSNWRYVAVEARCRVAGGTATGTLDVQKNGVSMHGGAPFNFATMTSATWSIAYPAAPVSLSSTTPDQITLVTSALANTITDLHVIVWISQAHVGT